MRTILDLNESLVRKAQCLTGLKSRTALIHAGLNALIERESARHFASVGGGEASSRPTTEEVRRDPLAELRGEFDALVAHMQTPEHQAGVEALFAADGRELSEILKAHAKKRKKISPAK